MVAGVSVLGTGVSVGIAGSAWVLGGSGVLGTGVATPASPQATAKTVNPVKIPIALKICRVKKNKSINSLGPTYTLNQKADH